jgi:hypothetical protein
MAGNPAVRTSALEAPNRIEAIRPKISSLIFGSIGRTAFIDLAATP